MILGQFKLAVEVKEWWAYWYIQGRKKETQKSPNDKTKQINRCTGDSSLNEIKKYNSHQIRAFAFKYFLLDYLYIVGAVPVILKTVDR